MTTNTTAPRHLDTKATAAHLRKTLRAAFPGTRFSVRMDRGTAYGWLTVTWTDGPTDEAVSAITTRYESSRFSGMDDSYHTTANTLKIATNCATEAVRPSCRGVSTIRQFSDAAKTYASTITGITRSSTPSVFDDGELELWRWLKQADLTA